MRLVLIGLIAGFFGALFGVGGGIVLVPMLIAVSSFSPRPAMATSLVAIGLIALEGAVFYGIHGDLKPLDAMVLGFPAAIGAAAGTVVQQRLGNRTLALAFSGVLVAVAIRLFI